jgi:type VI secretion system protein ImpE
MVADIADARAALRTGDVRLAMDLLKAEVRRAPRDARLRTFLFQLFCVTGEWDRALTQLAVAGQLDRAAEPMVQTYRALVRCEVLRESVFAGRRSPTVLGEPGEWVPLLIEATRLLAQGETTRATDLRDAAFEAAPETPATIDGAESAWMADADPRLGPVAEVVIDGRYVWVPYTRIRCIALEPPQDLRDQVWMPARFTWSNEGTAVGFLPTRYPGTAECSDPALWLAHRTEWTDRQGWSIPVGQRMLVTDTQEAALMDIRRIDLTPERPGATSAA